MKKTVLIFIISILAASCSLESSSNSSSNSITGTWTWQKSVGGIAGTTLTPESTGTQKKLLFSSDGKVTVYLNNEITATNTYEIKKGPSIFDEKESTLLIFGGNTYVIQFLTEDSFSLSDNFADGFSSLYKR
jgi:PKD repeat protein